MEDGSTSSLFLFEEPLSSVYSPKDQVIVNDLVAELFENGYFDAPKLPFQIYQHCKERLKKRFQSGLLMEGLAVYTRRKKVPRLVVGRSEEGWVTYKKL